MDRALTKGTTRYSHLIRSMVLSPLERTRMMARERAKVAQYVRICISLVVLVYSPTFLLLESPLLCLDARGAAGR
jgi:hypothetical protein